MAPKKIRVDKVRTRTQRVTAGALAAYQYGKHAYNAYKVKKLVSKLTRKKPMSKKRKSTSLRLVSHADMSLHKFRLPGKKATYKPHKDGRISYTDTYQKNVKGNPGVQTYYMGKCVHTLNQLGAANNTTENDEITNSTNIFSLLVNRATTGGGVITATTSPTTEAVYASYQRSMMSLTNFENVAVHCEIYWCLPRKDTVKNPIQEWENNDLNLALGQTVNSQPGTAAAVPLAGRPTPAFYGQDPTHNLYWNKYWKVLKKKEFILQAGNTLRMEYTRPIHQNIRKPDLEGLLTGFLKGLTLVPIFIFKGSPVNSYVTTEGIAASLVNYSSISVGIMQSDTIIYHQIPEKSVPYNRVFTSNITAATNLITQRFIDDEDQVENVQEA